MGVGVANGVLAVVRDKPISPRAAAITAAVIAAGEVALIYDLPADERPDMVPFILWSLFGTYVGLAGFVSWENGEPSFFEKVGEGLADWAAAPQLEAG